MIPNLFTKQPIPSDIPENLRIKIEEFKQSNDKEEFLKKAFFYVTSQCSGGRGNLFFKFRRLFQKDINIICNTKGYKHCTTANFLLRTMVISSGLFKEEDIELKPTHTWYIAPHQYLRIRLTDNKYINLDPWNYRFGIDYGNYGSGFASIKLKPIR